jgi:hypothetical protein
MNKIKFFLLNWIWQFPQMLLGAILTGILKAQKRLVEINGKEIYYCHFERNTKFSRFISGVSLGTIILLSDDNDNDVTILHESGHSIQSLYLGWLYLPVIGLYSALFCNLWDRWFHQKWTREERSKWYYSRWCEAWADKLGGVERVSY